MALLLTSDEGHHKYATIAIVNVAYISNANVMKVDLKILLLVFRTSKLNHYGIRGVLNDWFISYLSNLYQYVSINGYESGLAAINCGVP